MPRLQTAVFQTGITIASGPSLNKYFFKYGNPFMKEIFHIFKWMSIFCKKTATFKMKCPPFNWNHYLPTDISTFEFSNEFPLFSGIKFGLRKVKRTTQFQIPHTSLLLVKKYDDFFSQNIKCLKRTSQFCNIQPHVLILITKNHLGKCFGTDLLSFYHKIKVWTGI